MDILNTIFGTAVGAGAGGIFGILGAGISAWVKFKTYKADMEHEKDKWAAMKEMKKLDMQADQEENEQLIARLNAEGSWNSMTASMKADAVVPTGTPSSALWIKIVYRPFLTTMLFIMTAWIYYTLVYGTALQAYLTKEMIIDLIRYIIYSVVFTSCSAGTWWFAERALTPPNWKNR
jgi:hypothetical protein